MCSVDPDWPNGVLNRNCNGRLVSTGGSVGPTLVALAMQLLGIALFFAFPARYLLEVESNPAAIVLGAILAFISLSCFAITALIDPGVIPPAEMPLYQMKESRPPRTQHVMTSQGRCTLRYCDACNIFRPPRVEHCPTCRNCILKYDHHCPWVGNCIGERNYRFFYGFLLGICSFVLLAVASSIAELVLRNKNKSAFDVNSSGSLALLLYSFMCGTFVFALCGLHSYLVAMDKTTYELFREFAKADQRKPGIRTAFISFVNLCGPTTPSLVRDYYRSSKKDAANRLLVAKEVGPNEVKSVLLKATASCTTTDGETQSDARELISYGLFKAPIDYDDDENEFDEDERMSQISRSINDMREGFAKAAAAERLSQSLMSSSKTTSTPPVVPVVGKEKSTGSGLDRGGEEEKEDAGNFNNNNNNNAAPSSNDAQLQIV